MKRFAALGLLFTSTAAFAGEPVSVHPPAPPASSGGSSLNQSLPAAIQSALPAVAPPPVLTSTPSWSQEPVVPSGGQTIPTVAPNYLAPAPAAAVPPMAAPAPGPGCAPVSCAPACGPTVGGSFSQTSPHLNLLKRPGWVNGASSCETGGCNTDKPCRERLKAWLHFQPTPSGAPIWCPTPYQAPLRAYFPARPTDCAWNLGCAVGGGGCGTAGCGMAACAADRGTPLRDKVGGLLQRPATCDVSIPTTPLTAAGDCATGNCRPRVNYVPIPTRVGEACADGAPCGTADRASVLDRVKGAVGGGGLRLAGHKAGCGPCSGAGVSFGGGQGCPPPAPSPVRYAAPCVVPPAPQPAVNYSTPTPFGGPATGTTPPATGVKGPNTAALPKPTPPAGDATVAFTNP